MPIRTLLVVLLASCGLVASVSPAAAAETVTFRLTLRGTVAPADVFTLGIQASNGAVYDVGVMCGPAGPVNPAGAPVCVAGSYDADLGGEIGIELAYRFARDRLNDSERFEVLLLGTITIIGSPQTVTLVYEYPGDPLPDTALPAPGS